MIMILRNMALLASVRTIAELFRFNARYVLRIYGNEVSGPRLDPKQIGDESVRFKPSKICS